MIPNKEHILNLIQNEQWENLCKYLRTWMIFYCSQYRQDERETIIQVWVCRMAIVKFQADESSYQGVHSQAQKDDMLHEINTQWDNAHSVYQQRMQQIADAEYAEVEVKKTLEKIQQLKQQVK